MIGDVPSSMWKGIRLACVPVIQVFDMMCRIWYFVPGYYISACRFHIDVIISNLNFVS